MPRPKDIEKALGWVFSQPSEEPLTENDSHEIVTLVRKYFNENQIEYNEFDFSDIEPYLKLQQ